MKKYLILMIAVLVFTSLLISQTYYDKKPSEPVIIDSRPLTIDDVKPVANLNVLSEKWKKKLPIGKKEIFISCINWGHKDIEAEKNILPVLEDYFSVNKDILWVLVTEKPGHKIKNGIVIVDTLTVQQEHSESMAKQLNFVSPVCGLYDKNGALKKWNLYYNPTHFESFIFSLKEDGDLIPLIGNEKVYEPLGVNIKNIEVKNLLTGKEEKIYSYFDKPVVMTLVYTEEMTSRQVMTYLNRLQKKYKNINFIVIGHPEDKNIGTYARKYPKLKVFEGTLALDEIMQFEMAPQLFFIKNEVVSYIVKGFGDYDKMIRENLLKK